MTVVERRGSMGRECGSKDQFPVGMRVLAVDDDPTCLKLLETLLLRCQYHVTTTGQAITALKLLRENKDYFDLVISDVHMPDMDGFKLLELVGLELDLPVIMLSANGETQAVMKGITHGACDYLLKPVRIEELRNIWQHVIRRRKFGNKDQINLDDEEDCEKVQIANYEGGQSPSTCEISDHNTKLNRKRKDQNEEDEDDCEENIHENEDPSTQKKPRVVWSVELHRKFVAAVNQLGIDKAVPKKILDMMNVEKLTRENVASHLQKYRLYLKRLSAVASQQANMVAAFGNRNPSYLPMGSLEGFRNFHSLAESRKIPALTSFQPSGVLGRMNNPTGFGQHSLVPSGTLQHGRIQSNTSNQVNDFRKLQGIGPLGNLHGNLLQGIPMSLEQDRLQQHKTVQEANNRSHGGFSGNGLAIGSSTNSFANVTNNSLLLQENQQHTQSGVLGSHSSAKVPSLHSDPFKIGLGELSPWADLGRCNDTWQGVVASTKYSTNTLPMAATSSHNIISPGNILNNVTPIISPANNNIHEASSSRVAVALLQASVIGNDVQVQHQASSLDGNTMLMPRGGDEDSKVLSNSNQKWEEQKQIHAPYPNSIISSSLDSSFSNLHTTDAIIENPTSNNGFSNENMDMTMIGQNYGAPFLAQDRKTDCQLNYKEDYLLDTTKLHNWFSPNGCNFDDLVNGMIKPEPNDVNIFDGEIASDIFSLGTCM